MAIQVPTVIKNISIGGGQPGTQYFLDDWVFIQDESKFSYLANNHVGVSDFDPRIFLSVGDPLRIKQGGNTKYFYVVAVSGTGFQVRAGKDYTFTSSTITEIRRAARPVPADFPFTFEFDPEYEASVGTYSNIDPNQFEKGFFFVQGNVCHLLVDVDNGSLTSDATLLWTPPIKVDIANGSPDQVMIISNNFTVTQGYVKFGGSNLGEIGSMVGVVSGGFAVIELDDLSATTNGLGFSYNLSYKINTSDP